MYSKKDLSFEEFKKTVFHTQYKIRIPLLNISLEKKDYFTKGKYDLRKVESVLLEIYEQNFK